jgi:hypothetical protein
MKSKLKLRLPRKLKKEYRKKHIVTSLLGFKDLKGKKHVMMIQFKMNQIPIRTYSQAL